MNQIFLQQTLPKVVADCHSIASDVWCTELSLQRGKNYLIDAVSGTGKSSLCSFLYGYRIDYQGNICFDNINIKNLTIKQWTEIHRSSLSMLFQDLKLFGDLTAFENVKIKNKLTGFKRKSQIIDFFE